MRAIILSLLLVLGGCASQAGPSSVTAEPADLAITNLNVVQVSTGTVVPAQTVLIADGRIVSIQEAASRPVAAARVVDGAGGYLIPGLVDAHAHLEHERNAEMLKLFVGYGVTTVRSMDGRPYILEWRDRIAAGELIGPRIHTAGPILDGESPIRRDNTVVADPAAGRAAVVAQAAAGYDFIKIYDRVSPATLDAILDEAAEQSMRVGGHPPDDAPMSDVLRAFWSIEHMTSFMGAVRAEGPETPWWVDNWLGAPVDEARAQILAAELAASDVWVVPTLWERERSAARPETLETWMSDPVLAHVGEAARDFWRSSLTRASRRLEEDDRAAAARGHQQRLALTRRLHEAGVRLVVGTDTPNPFVVPGEAAHRELEMFAAAGLTPLEALRAATSGPLEMIYGEMGEPIRPGARADLVILGANPLEDIAGTRDIQAVVLAGQLFDRDAVLALRSAYAASADAS
ncbi:amidohydrolase family protein [Brevundimonas sp. 2R-24]|uniref:Amidohydrolase family protein n=1 Tax=Peiella sedimenti TaxID=3061083 RepID=A0ABT8SNZ7_9CAUL|nr:amidohydrolase family protein [Caulobacteraceae bacterium XZ-24]